MEYLKIIGSLALYSFLIMSSGYLLFRPYRLQGASFSLNLVLAMLVGVAGFNLIFAIQKLFSSAPLDQTSLWIAYSIIIFTGLSLNRFKVTELFEHLLEIVSRNKLYISIAAVLSIVLLIGHYNRVMYEDLIVDGIEAFEYTRSLKINQVPYWDLENGTFGFIFNFVLFCYFNLISMLLLGEVDMAVRLPFFFFVFILFFTLLDLAKNVNGFKSLLLVPPILFFSIHNANYYTIDLFSDVSQPAGTDVLFTTVLLAQIIAIIEKRFKVYLILCFATTIASASGALFSFFILIAYAYLHQLNIKKTFTMASAIGGIIILYLASILIYQALSGEVITRPLYFEKWDEQGGDFSVELFLAHAKMFALSAGYFSLIAIFIPTKDKTANLFKLVMLAYLAVIIIGPRAKVHYYTSIALLPMLLVLRERESMKPLLKWGITGGMVISFSILAVLWYPLDREQNPFTSYSEYAAPYFVVAKDYRAALDIAAPATETFWPFWQSGPGSHVFVHYAGYGPEPDTSSQYLVSSKLLEIEGYVLERDSAFYLYKKQ